MNSRERVLSLLSGSCPDRVPWFGDLDYWYSAAVKGNALDAKYLADGYFQLNRDLGVGFYLQGFSPFRVHHKGVSFSETLDHGEITVDSPAECIMIPENLSSEVVGKEYYLKYMRGYESKWIKCIRQAGKHSFIHMDGTLKGLLKLVGETGFDVIEAVTPAPSGDMTMEEAAAEVTGDTILWGGLPGVVFTPNFEEEAFVAHVKYVLSVMRKKPGYVLGVADQVPPDGLIGRVGMVSSLCEEYGRY